MFVPDYNIGDYEVEVDDQNLVARVIYSPTGKPIIKFTGEHVMRGHVPVPTLTTCTR